MLGWIICREGHRPALEERRVGGVDFLVLQTPRPDSRRQRHRLHRLLREMARRGVRRAVVQGGDVPELAQWGILPVDSVPLRRALLPQLLQWADGAWQLGLPQGAVVLRADASDAAAWQAALTLSRMARYIHLDTGPGQDALAARLRRTVGLGSGGGEPVLEVCLGQKSGGVRPALHLGRQSAARQRLELWTPQLQGEESLLCALFQAEKLQIEDIQIRFVEFRA